MNDAADIAAAEPSETSRVMMRTWGGILWLLVLVSVLVMMSTSPAVPDKPAGKPDLTIEVDGVEQDVKLVQRKVAPFEFTERSGETITNEDLLGKPWAVNFIFTSCVMTCPANTTAMMKLAQQCEDEDVRFVTITVDPERDTPERLRDYAEIYGADPEKWLFLTGEKEKIHDLIIDNFLQVVEEQTGENRLLGYEFAHSDRVMHIDENGMIVGQYLSTDPKEMVKLGRVLAGEAETPEENRFLVAELEAKTDEETPNTERTKFSATDAAKIQQTVEPETDVEPAEAEVVVPSWLETLPAVNALLNSIATLLLLSGYVLIRQGNKSAHKVAMISAFAVSVLFLASYLTYHFGLQYYTGESSKKFPDLGFVRQVYLSILFSHIILAVSVPVLALTTLYQAWRQNWQRHKFWARITFPIWVYVSITGVVIYVMLYQIAA